jgi:tight adherence protein B
MNIWIISVALGAAILLIVEFRSIGRNRSSKNVRNSLPGFVELYCSAIQSGISIEDAFAYMSVFKIEGLGSHLRKLEADLARGSAFDQALNGFRDSLATSESDRFVAILKLAHQTGGQNLISNLQALASELRLSNTSEGAINARLGAIQVVAKLGLLAPWVLVALLSINEQSRNAYLSDAGGLLLLVGFLVSVVAYRLVLLAGRSFHPPRILDGFNA